MWVVSIRVFYNLFGDQIVFCEREIFHMVVHALKKGDIFFQEKVFLTCQSFIFHALKYWQHSSFHKTLGSAWSCQAKMAFVRHVKRFQSGKIRVKKMTQEEFLTVSICFKMLRLPQMMGSIFLLNHISTFSRDIFNLITNVTSKLS